MPRSHSSSRSPRPLRPLIAGALVTLITACWSVPVVTTPPEPPADAAMDASDAASNGPPIVQVRSFPSSSIVSVVGWTPGEAAYGLRGDLRRDGTLVGSRKTGEHRFYVSSFYVRESGGFRYAAVPPSTVLSNAGATRDYDACHGDLKCSPIETVGLAVPDSVLRANRDSLVVVFRPFAKADWSLLVPRDLIDAYLKAVDSVSASLRAAREPDRPVAHADLPDLRPLRWIEGAWRGSGTRGTTQAPFFERYHFQDDSTLLVESFTDSTLVTVTETSRWELREGRFGNTGSVRWVASSVDTLGATFSPVAGARNSFRWERQPGSGTRPAEWLATITTPRPQDEPARRFFLMQRIR